MEGLQRQLSAASPCDDTIFELIPVYWELTAAESCWSTYVHFLATKREMILAMMGCEAKSVDTAEKHRVMTSTTVADSQSFVRAQSQSTGSSSRFTTGHGETRYDEKSYALSRGDSDRHAFGSLVGDGTSFFRDDGRGSGSNVSSAWNEIEAVDTEVTQDQSESASTDTGFRSDCNYEYSQNQTHSAQGTLIVAVAAATTGASEWRKYAFTRGADEDASNYIRNFAKSQDARDERRGQGSHNWFNFFNSNVEWHDRDYEVRRNHDRMDRSSHMEAQSQGDGDGMSEDKTEGKSSSQATGKSEYQGLTNRTHNVSDVINEHILINSQRFRNLTLLYDQITEQIEHAKARARANDRPLTAYLPCSCGSCLSCVGRMARRLCAVY